MQTRNKWFKLASCLLVIMTILPGCNSKQPSGNTISVTAELRPEINYVTHLYTLAGLGFSDDEYTAKYGETLPQTAKETLQLYKDQAYMPWSAFESLSCWYNCQIAARRRKTTATSWKLMWRLSAEYMTSFPKRVSKTQRNSIAKALRNI